MAVVTVSADGLRGIDDLPYGIRNPDKRFRQWGKLIRDTNDVNLKNQGGYSIHGPWVQWGKSIAVAPGQFLVLASETGSRARHGYDYALLTVVDDNVEMVSEERIAETIVQTPVSDAERANAKNSPLYAYALYVRIVSDER